VTEKAGTFINWEGRQRPFDAALPPQATADMRVLAALADEVGVDLGLPDAATARAELATLGTWQGARPAAPDVAAAELSLPAAGQAILTGWRMLLDAGRLQDGETYLAGTARPVVVRLSQPTSAEIGAADGDLVTVSTTRGAISLPLEVTDMPDRVVWLPLNSPGSDVASTLGASIGALVSIGRGGEPE
jgi:NADH-quinone oxidoreductase subunit G